MTTLDMTMVVHNDAPAERRDSALGYIVIAETIPDVPLAMPTTHMAASTNNDNDNFPADDGSDTTSLTHLSSGTISPADSTTCLVATTAEDDTFIVDCSIPSPELSPATSTLSLSTASAADIILIDNAATERAQAQERLPSFSKHPMFKWVMLLVYIIVNGSSLFMQRLEVVRHGADELTPSTFIVYYMGGSWFVTFSYFLFRMLRSLPKAFPYYVFFKGVIMGFGIQCGYGLYILMTQDGAEASLLAPLSSLWAIIPLAYFIIFKRERVTLLKGLGLVMSLASLLLFALATIYESGAGSGNFTLGKKNLIIFIAFIILWGWGTIVLQNIAHLPDSQFFVGMFGYPVGGALSIVLFAFVIFRDFDITVPVLPHFSLLTTAGFINALGLILFLILCRALPNDMAIVSPLCSTSVLVPIVLGIAALGESTPPLKMAGIVVAVVGVPLMGYQKKAKPCCCQRQVLTAPCSGTCNKKQQKGKKTKPVQVRPYQHEAGPIVEISFEDVVAPSHSPSATLLPSQNAWVQ